MKRKDREIYQNGYAEGFLQGQHYVFMYLMDKDFNYRKSSVFVPFLMKYEKYKDELMKKVKQ